MSKGGGGPSYMFLPQQQSQSSSSEVKLPDWVNRASQANYNQAAAVAPQLSEYYQGPMVAPMNAGQINAIAGINANVGAANGAYQAASNAAYGAVNAANPLFAAAARQTQGAMNPASVQNSIGGLQGLAGQGYSQVNGPGQAYTPIDFSQSIGNVDTSGMGYNSVNSALPSYNQISPSFGFDRISSPLGYNTVNAGRDPTQSAQGAIGQAMNAAQPAIGAAMAGTMGAARQANNIADVNARDVSAQSLPQGDLNAYMNPFTNNVINSSLAVLDQQRKQALNQDADAAINSKAFGGSRQAIREAATNSQYGLQGAQLAANLNNQNFNQAVQNMQADQARNLQAQQSNQSAGLQADLANQQMGLNVANLGLGAANQLGNLGINSLGQFTNSANTLGSLGLNSNAQNLQAQQANQGAALQYAGLNQAGQIANQNAGIQTNAQNLQAQQANQGAALQAANQSLQAQQANQSAGLTNQQQILNALLANQSAGLQNKQMDIGAQQANAGFALQNAGLNQQAALANQNAGLQSQQNAMSALQNAGNLGLGLGNLNMGGANQLANIGDAYSRLGMQNAQLQGALTGQQQADYLNSLNNSLTASGNIQNQMQNEITGAQQQLAARQAAAIAPVNLQMQALGMSPYGQTTNSTGSSSGFTTQMYQPTSSNLGMSLLGGGLAGMNALGNLGNGAGGLISLGSKLAAFASDEDMKTNIQKLGRDPESGMDMYAYDYKDDVKAAKKSGKPMPPKRVGPMAQDIEKYDRKAVRKVGGKKVVNLGMGMA